MREPTIDHDTGRLASCSSTGTSYHGAIAETLSKGY